jgi:SLOG cluster2
MNPTDTDAEGQPSSPKSATGSLEGIRIGISVALGEDSALHGFGEEEMNRAIVRLSDSLLSSGAQLAFGHDWRPNGVMSAVARLAVSYDPGIARTDDQSGGRSCRITNLVPWGRRPELPPDLRDDLEQRGILRVEEVGLPPAIAAHEQELTRRTLRATGLCVLRRRLTSLCDARICLGGKFRDYEGFWPGILEEALASALSGPEHTLLISGIMGGATEKVLQAARSADWRDFIQPKSEGELGRGFEEIRTLDPSILPEMLRAPELLSRENLERRSGLDAADWQRLAGARDIEVVAALVIKALLKKKRA